MSREIPYRPFHRPKLADETEVAAMFEKLAKHAKPQVQVHPNCIPTGIQPELLKWLKPVTCADGSVHLASECGHYRIERYDGSGKRVYFAMTYAPEFRHELGRRFSADEAKALCEAEARKRAARDAVPATGCGDGADETGGT